MQTSTGQTNKVQTNTVARQQFANLFSNSMQTGSTWSSYNRPLPNKPNKPLPNNPLAKSSQPKASTNSPKSVAVDPKATPSTNKNNDPSTHFGNPPSVNKTINKSSSKQTAKTNSDNASKQQANKPINFKSSNDAHIDCMDQRQFIKYFHKSFGMTPDEARQTLIKNVPGSGIKAKHIKFDVNDEGNGEIICRINRSAGLRGVGVDIEVMLDVRKGAKLATLDTAKVADSSQGQGLLKGVFAGFLAIASEKPGSVNKMKMVANLTVGGYAWARCGFAPANFGQARQVCRYSAKIIGRYLKEVDPGNKPLKKLFNELQSAGNSKKPNRRIIRKIAALNLPIPTEHAKNFTPSNGPGDIKGGLTLGKACLLGTQWTGTFSLKSDKKYLEAYIGIKLPQGTGKTSEEHEEAYNKMTWGK